MELSFLVDVNLPKYFHYFNHENFVYVADIDPTWTDHRIWNYALENDLVILTKDTDFYNRFISSNKSPKVVYFQLGNQTLRELHQYFRDNWDNIQDALKNAKFIIACREQVFVVQ
ncbi:MAG TPA: DUF5615 family PIN-like protein [Bacteroidales bacterium]|nr:DUF5615 family PIN-like protein [Bacteroidales bacterium]